MSTVPEVGERRRRRTVGCAMLIGVGLMMMFAVWKVQLNSASEEVLLAQGVAHLDKALGGDAGEWADARYAFRQAASQNTFDPYPVFCLSRLDELEARVTKGRKDPSRSDFETVTARVISRDYDGAREALEDMTAAGSDSESLSLKFYKRLVAALSVAKRRSTLRRVSLDD